MLPEQWGSSAQAVDFFDIKSDLEAILALHCDASEFEFVATEHAALQPGQAANIVRGDKVVGVVGKLHPVVAKSFDVKKDVYLFELDAEQVFKTGITTAVRMSKYPAIRRDISFLVSDEISAAKLIAAVASTAPKLIQKITIFDIYKGPGVEAGLKSVALGLILQETSRTLTDEDADSAKDAAVRKLEQEFAARLRE